MMNTSLHRPAQEREPFLRATPTHLVVSSRALLTGLGAAAAVGLVLAVIGLRDAYTKVGGHGTPAGTVITVAILIAAVAVTGVSAISVWQVMRARRTD